MLYIIYEGWNLTREIFMPKHDLRKLRDAWGYNEMSFRSTGTPKGFTDLPMDFVLYMIIGNGRVLFISAGKDPWATATRLRKKYKADRIIYMPTSYLKAEETVAALVAHYQPPYNFKSQSIELAELDAILEN